MQLGTQTTYLGLWNTKFDKMWILPRVQIKYATGKQTNDAVVKVHNFYGRIFLFTWSNLHFVLMKIELKLSNTFLWHLQNNNVIWSWPNSKLLRTVPTSKEVFFARLMTMREKQILSRAIEIQKENFG